MKPVFSFVAGMALCALSVHGATIYDESVSGDLSGVFGAPTPVTLSDGANTIIGQMGNNGESGAVNGSGDPVPNDADYFSFTVGAGASVVSLNIDAFTFSPSDPGSSFMAYTVGAAFSGHGAGDIDGQVLFNAGSGDVLPTLAGGPLGPGTYSIWVQETASTVVDYQLTLTQIPEPTGALLFLVGAVALAMRRLR